MNTNKEEGGIFNEAPISMHLSEVIADAIKDFAKKNPYKTQMKHVLSALGTTTANLLVLCDSKEGALKVAARHGLIVCDLIQAAPDSAFGETGEVKNEGE